MSLPSSLDTWIEADEEAMSTILNCLCPLCEQYTGTTLVLPSRVPYFREIIIMHLTCNSPTCGFRNSEVSFGGEIQLKGVKSTLTASSSKDLNRQIIKSDYCTITLPHLSLEIPPITQKGTVTTLEGVLKKTADQLQEGQADRLTDSIDVFTGVQKVIEGLNHILADGDGSYPFTLVIDDPSGNSFVENPAAPNADPLIVTKSYERTANQ